jgi:hypothetical protein
MKELVSIRYTAQHGGLIVAALTAWTMFGVGKFGIFPDLAGYGLMVSSGALCVFFLLAGRGDGVSGAFNRAMGTGFAAHCVADLFYQVYPPGDRLGFADAFYYVAYAYFLLAGLRGTVFLSQLLGSSTAREVSVTGAISLAFAAVMHGLFGLQRWAQGGFELRLTYLLDLLLITASAAMTALFLRNAYRSKGGLYQTLFALPALGLTGALVADTLFAINRSGDAYTLGDSSDLIRLTGQLAMFAFLMIQSAQQARQAIETASSGWLETPSSQPLR